MYVGTVSIKCHCCPRSVYCIREVKMTSELDVWWIRFVDLFRKTRHVRIQSAHENVIFANFRRRYHGQQIDMVVRDW